MNPMASIRAERGESQYEAAARIGIAQSTYAQIEIGSRRPSVDTAKLIGKEMGFDWTVFFEDPTDDGAAAGEITAAPEISFSVKKGG